MTNKVTTHYKDHWAKNEDGFVQTLMFNGKTTLTRFGRLWHQMKARTDPNGVPQRGIGKSYKGVRMAFADFQEFCGWLIQQPMWWDKDWQIDKDLLSGASKVYSPTTCCLLPRELNLALKGPYKHQKSEDYYREKKLKIIRLAEKYRTSLKMEVYSALLNFQPN